MYVNLSNLPDPPKQYQAYIKNLSGGLNTSKAPTDILDNQSSDMVNMLWEDGVLRSRKGTETIASANQWSSGGSTPLAMFEKVWHRRLFLAFVDSTGDTPAIKIATFDTRERQMETIYECVVAETPGDATFFQFGEKLYFKCRGLYLCIAYDDEGDTMSAEPVVPYVPIVQINTNRNGVGDLYQPENRISDTNEIWFNADPGTMVVELPCDGESTTFDLGYTRLQLAATGFAADGELLSVDEVYVGAVLYTRVETLSAVEQYTVDIERAKLTLYEAPPIGLKVTARVTLTARRYRLPSYLQGVRFVSVTVNGEAYRLTTGIPSAPKEYGIVSVGAQGVAPEILFSENLGAWNDANGNANRIKVVYRLPNPDAQKAIDDCCIACAYGASGIEQNCVVFAGSNAQPNAFFWSGNDANGANPAYFPMEQYNLVGEYSDPIIAFGRQQNRLVIFQGTRISSAEYAFTTVDDRVRVSLNVKTINDKIGCIARGSVQVVENNLVWLNSNGVMYLKDSTYAYETLVVCISGNISSIFDRPAVRKPSFAPTSFDDGSRYWLFLGNGEAIVWDYSIQGYTSNTERLSWFYINGIRSVAWAMSEDGEIYGLRPFNTEEEYLFRFADVLTDCDKTFSKSVTLKTQYFGTYAYLKNVEKLIVSMPTDRVSRMTATYLTDYEARADLMPIDNACEVSQNGRNERLAETGWLPAAVRVRKPKCNHVHQFTVRFENNEATDMAIASVQLFYSYRGATKSGRMV